jgi:tricarballylate dehydrogenase
VSRRCAQFDFAGLMPRVYFPSCFGVGITEKAEVKDSSGNVIGGLFAAGEITGGSFFNNYPGGSGLMKGAIFGRLAGTSAAAFAEAHRA